MRARRDGRWFGVLVLGLALAVPPYVAPVPGSPPPATLASLAPALVHTFQSPPTRPLAPRVGPSNVAVLSTTSLINGTRWSGNVLVPAGLRPVAAVYDSLDQRVFVAVAGPPPGVVAFDPVQRAVVGFWPLRLNGTAAPTAIAYDPSDGRIFVANGMADNLTIFSASNGSQLGTVGLGVGSRPEGLAFVATTDAIYVAEAGRGRVVPVNATSGGLGIAIGVGSIPDAIAYDPFLGYLVVADRGSASVNVIGVGSSAGGFATGVGSSPDGIGFDPSTGNVLVANAGSNNVTILNYTTLRSAGSFGTGRSPGGLAVTTDGLAYVPNAGDSNVTVYNDGTGGLVRNIPTGSEPGEAVWDGTSGEIFVEDSGSDSVSILDGVNPGGHTEIALGAAPFGLGVVAPGGAFAVAVADHGTVAIIQTISGALTSQISTGGSPRAVAADPVDGRLDASVDPPVGTVGNVTELNTSSASEVARYTAGSGPNGLAYDRGTGDLFVADLAGRTVSVINASSGGSVATIPVPTGGTGSPTADQVLSDPTNGLVYVSEGPSNASVLVLNASTDSVASTIPTPGGPAGLALDPANGRLYVADSGAQAVSEIDPAAGRVVANVTLPGDPMGICYDPRDGRLYAAVPVLAEVIAVDLGNRSIAQSWPVGTSPTWIACDPTSGEVLVGDPGQGTVALIGPPPPLFPVRFVESGWNVSGPGWTVRVDGIATTSPSSTLWANQSNGSHTFSVASEPPYVPTPASGNFSVQGQPVTITISFATVTYGVEFQASGLPVGTTWWVDLAGVGNRSSSNHTVAFAAPNGTYGYTVGSGAPFVPAPGTAAGILTVAGFSLPVFLVSFVPLPPYVLRFHETGLPAGTNWSVYLQGGQSATSPGANLSLAVGNGTFVYSIPTVQGEGPSPSHGQVTVSGRSPPPIAVVFGGAVLSRYAVWFISTGLPRGSSFNVSVQGEGSATGQAVEFNLTNGSYRFVVSSAGGLRPDPANGFVIVRGQPINETITFSSGGKTSTLFSGPVPWILAGAGIAGAGLIAIGFWYRRPGGRRPRRVEAELVRSGPDPSAPLRDAEPIDASTASGMGGNAGEGTDVDPEPVRPD